MNNRALAGSKGGAVRPNIGRDASCTGSLVRWGRGAAAAITLHSAGIGSAAVVGGRSTGSSGVSRTGSAAGVAGTEINTGVRGIGNSHAGIVLTGRVGAGNDRGMANPGRGVAVISRAGIAVVAVAVGVATVVGETLGGAGSRVLTSIVNRAI